MSRFKKKANVKQEIPTSSMPDVVFMLLFFFMVTTVLRDDSVKVLQRLPEASQMRRLQNKNLVGYLFVGSPKVVSEGTEPKIQANDIYITPKQITNWVNENKGVLETDVERSKWVVSLKVDRETTRGIIADVETELRNSNTRRLLYSTSTLIEKK